MLKIEVKPIKNRYLEKDFEQALKDRDVRGYVFYLLSSRTGFRQGELLRRRIRDVKDQRKLGLTEQKTGKYREIPIPSEIRKALVR